MKIIDIDNKHNGGEADRVLVRWLDAQAAAEHACRGPDGDESQRQKFITHKTFLDNRVLA